MNTWHGDLVCLTCGPEARPTYPVMKDGKALGVICGKCDIEMVAPTEQNIRDNGVTFEPKGYRDVYWCYQINEPGIIEYSDAGNNPRCGLCKWESDEEIPDASFLTQHRFICHILKPVSKTS